MYLAAALAFWVKGAIGIVAIAGPIAIDAWSAGAGACVRRRCISRGCRCSLPRARAWPLVLHRRRAASGRARFLRRQRLVPDRARDRAGQYLGGHKDPFWYYLPRLFGQVGWIALFVPAAAAWLWRGEAPPGWRCPRCASSPACSRSGVLLLSIPGTKRGLYLLPFEPPLAVAIGAWIAATARARGVPVAGRIRGVLAVRGVRRLAAACARAPLRVAALAFAAAIVWNVAATPLSRSGHELEPVARGVGERIGGEPLLALSLDEAMLGALPFYTGQIPARLRDSDRLASAARRAQCPLPARSALAPRANRSGSRPRRR